LHPPDITAALVTDPALIAGVRLVGLAVAVLLAAAVFHAFKHRKDEP
jgi:hypothetical protein